LASPFYREQASEETAILTFSDMADVCHQRDNATHKIKRPRLSSTKLMSTSNQRGRGVAHTERTSFAMNEWQQKKKQNIYKQRK